MTSPLELLDFAQNNFLNQQVQISYKFRIISNRYLKCAYGVNFSDADDAAQPAHGGAATLPDLAVAHHQHDLPTQHRIGRPLLKKKCFKYRKLLDLKNF